MHNIRSMKNLIVIAALALFAFACSKDREAPNGLKVKVFKEGTGPYAKSGEFIVARMIVKDAKDSVWRDTEEQNVPIIIPIGDDSTMDKEQGVNGAFRVMKTGDSVCVEIDAKTLFGSNPIPPQLKPEDKLKYIFAVRDITDQSGVNMIQRELQEREMARMKSRSDAQLGMDTVALDTYLAERNIKAQRDNSGLRYVVTKMGKGPRPTVASTIKVTYKGMLMDGKIFDQSKGQVEWPLSQMIDGWKIGFPLLPKGSAAVLYIPSSLGYGENGYYPDIPANANLIFEVELFDVKN